MPDIGALINQFGLPVALLIYFIWRDYQTNREHKADMRDIAVKAVQALDKSTEVLEREAANTATNTEVIAEAKSLMSEVKGVLSTQGGASHGRSNT